ncbi:hypothetical protein [Streptomyces sp. NPDC096193]|uniref:hypothetical protein n=1 Tax=Streptomyces sp. NPDC096193 TaxID=3155821 RepID=UPI00331DFCE9
MGYAQGGGLTDERRAFREKLRVEAAERFRQGNETESRFEDLEIDHVDPQRASVV